MTPLPASEAKEPEARKGAPPEQGKGSGKIPLDNAAPTVYIKPMKNEATVEEIKVGDSVRVTSGPAFVQGMPIKGRVEEVTPWEGANDAEVMVRVASGGLWGFNMSHLTKLR